MEAAPVQINRRTAYGVATICKAAGFSSCLIGHFFRDGFRQIAVWRAGVCRVTLPSRSKHGARGNG